MTVGFRHVLICVILLESEVILVVLLLFTYFLEKMSLVFLDHELKKGVVTSVKLDFRVLLEVLTLCDQIFQVF